MESTHPQIKRALLVILDGFGVNPDGDYNGITHARMPRLDDYFARYPHTILDASGPAVGLPEGQMGNSEVGHMTLGCGCIVRQDLVRINDAISAGSFYTNPALLAAVDRAKQSKRPVHLLGLVSDGGVHSHIDHLLALLELCARENVRPVLHMITDGRDTAPSNAQTFIERIQPSLEKVSGRIASVIGRYYAMDRDRRWERIELAWRALIEGTGLTADSAKAAIDQAYKEQLTDEFILPTLIAGGECIGDGDEVIFFNFRNDRSRQLTSALVDIEFDQFERGKYGVPNVTTMTEFDAAFSCAVAYSSEQPTITLSQVVSDLGLSQFHCAETEKYPHVTYFLNGGREKPHQGEVHKMVPSPKVATYDLKPEMSAKEVADEVVAALNDEQYSFIVVNFANGDMVGHTAVRAAIIQALEAMDEEVGRVLDAAVENNVSVLLTADHGNCDEMVDALTGEPHTQHTVNPVPCLIVDSREGISLLERGGLSMVAPTILKLMGVEKPKEMTSQALL